MEADGTLLLTPPRPSGGTRMTAQIAHRSGKPWLAVDPSRKVDREDLILKTLEWLDLHQIKVLNVAGPRESKIPGIYEISCKFLRKLLEKKA